MRTKRQLTSGRRKRGEGRAHDLRIHAEPLLIRLFAAEIELLSERKVE